MTRGSGSSQPLEEAVRRATELHNARDFHGFAACYADPCTYHSGRHAQLLSRSQHADAVESYFEVFPDFTASIRSLFAKGDRAFVRWTYTGTHLGTSPSGVPPTGVHVDVGTIYAEMRFEDGLIVEFWELMDFVPLDEIGA